MERDNLLLVVAAIAVALAIVGVGVVYNSFSVFNSFFTGFAIEDGTVVLTIDTRAEIKIISANGTEGSKILNWGSGVFDAGVPSALLVSNGTVVGGNWPNVTKGFVVENVGNLNVSLNISSTEDASAFLGGTSPLFQYNITNIETDSCTFAPDVENEWKDFTTIPVRVCNNFGYIDTNDAINIDILVQVPNDGKTGELLNTIILSYESV